MTKKWLEPLVFLAILEWPLITEGSAKGRDALAARTYRKDTKSACPIAIKSAKKAESEAICHSGFALKAKPEWL